MKARHWCFCAAVLLAVLPAGAQGTAFLRGTVTDADGVALAGAAVSIAGTTLKVRTDAQGEFHIANVGAGKVHIDVRRLGFSAETLVVEVQAGGTLDRLQVRLTPLPSMLDKVVVQGSRMKYTGRLAGYYQRLERRSSGQFITRQELDRHSGTSLSQVLARSPGVSSLRLGSGGGAVRLRGRSCRPLVWLDGVSMPAGEVDLDAFPVHTLHGVELYLGSTTTPLDFTAQQNRSSCGTILLWSRGSDTDPRRRASRQTVDVESLVASLSVHTAAQVDRRAELENRDRIDAAYPPDLFATGQPGRVVAEFIVDANGEIEDGSFAIVSATHETLRAAVSRAMEKSRFVPALKNGIAVRQFVRQQFDFSPGSMRVSGLR